MFEYTTKQGFRTKKSAATFERMFRVATELFRQKGFRGATMRDISRKSKLGLGALYYYFRSKEELVLFFYQYINQQVIEDFQSRHKTFRSFPDTVAAFIRLKLEHLGPYRNLLRIVVKEAIDPESPLCPLNPASSKTLFTNVGFFQELVEKTGRARGEEAREMARGLWIAHMGILVYWLHDRSKAFKATHQTIDTLAAALRLSSNLARIPGLSKYRKQFLSHVAELFPKDVMASAASSI